MQISYRSIAKLLAKGMPIDGQDYSDKVENYIKSIEAMPVEQQSALKAAYIFSGLTREYERQDLFQELVAHILTVLAEHKGRIQCIEGFCYAVARHKWRDKWLQKKKRKEILNGDFISLNEPILNGDGQEVELQELLTGKLEWTTILSTNLESEIISKLGSQAVLNALPDRVKAIVITRLLDRERLSSSECNILHRHIKQNGHKIREALKA